MRCALCPGTYACIEPSGPKCSDYGNESQTLYIGEAPGKDENTHGIPFVGKTGRELESTYLPTAGLRRSTMRVSNAIRCLPATSGHKLDPKNKSHLALLQSCTEANLYPEIRETRPKLIVPMGSFACRAIEPEINLELHHGFPVETKWGTAFPMYHPAQGMHEPKKMRMIREDWYRLKLFLAGELHVPTDPYPYPDYAEVTDVRELNYIDPTSPMACDTESSRSFGPYCLTYSQAPGEGRLIRSDRGDLLQAFQHRLDRWKSVILFHNWLYDWRVVEEMGLQFPHKAMRDTMVRAFHLGNIPQGLKALAYRELGMEMEDFEDLVLPFSKPHVIEYYEIARQLSWPKPEPVEIRQDDGSYKTKKPQGMNTKLNRFFTDLAKNDDKDVFGMWDNWEHSHEMMEEKLGRWPGADIAHVPYEKVKYYAIRDADATIRLHYLLEGMRRVVRKFPQERWRWEFTPKFDTRLETV